VIDLSLVFVTGLLSSLHCVGMCGPIVLAYSLAGDVPRSSARFGGVAIHAAYNSGRILSYALLGAVAGLAGMAFSFVRTAGEYVSIVGGVIMIAAGLALLGLWPAKSDNKAGFMVKGLARVHSALLRSPTVGSKMALGLLTPLLPCGILYAMVVKAAATQSLGYGALTMGLFAVGMSPALMLMGSLSSFFTPKARKRAEQLAAVTVIFLGIMLLLRGFGVPYLSWLSLGGVHHN